MKKPTQEESPSDIDRFKTGNYQYFAKEASKEEGVKLISASDLKNPEGNGTGSFSLDFDLVIPIPTGKIIEIYGAEGSGKSTLAFEIIGQALKRGKRALYLNMERNLNRSFINTIRTLKPFLREGDLHALDNLNTKDPFSVLSAPNGEVALELARKWCATQPNSVLVLDSIDACVPAAVLAGEIGEHTMGAHARLMSDAMRKLINAVDDNNVTFVCINQLRNKMTSYGDPRTTTGGEAVKFYASQRIEVQKPGKAEMIRAADGEDPVGYMMRYKVIKNKCAPQGIEGAVPILYYNGIFREQEIVDLSIKFGLLKLGGKGGRQILLPTFKDDGSEGDPIGFSKFNAARRLLLDQKLCEHLSTKLSNFLSQCTIKSNPIEDNEVQDS